MTNPATSLPSSLISRYHGWRATSFQENKAWYARLAEGGQHPRTMIISCCDSRVHATTIFGADTGDFFIHRNIANLVPPYAPNEDYHGTSAAVEYAVTALGVTNLIVMGHSLCGGIQGCHDMCSGKAPELEKATSFVGRWMDILRPGFERVKHISDEAERVAQLEREAVIVSVENLMTFPFVKSAVEKNELTLHGLWTDIAEGTLEQFDATSQDFIRI